MILITVSNFFCQWHGPFFFRAMNGHSALSPGNSQLFLLITADLTNNYAPVSINSLKKIIDGNVSE